MKEAMAVGILDAASDHSGVGELVQNGRTGFLIPEGDVQALSGSLAKSTELAPTSELSYSSSHWQCAEYPSDCP